MLKDIRDSLGNLWSSYNDDDGEVEEAEEYDTELGKLSEDDKSGWVTGTISKTVQLCMESFWQTQMKRDKLTQLGWGYVANYNHERDKKRELAELKVLAVHKLETDQVAAAAAVTRFGELIETLDIVSRKSQMLQGTSRQGCSHMRLGSGKPQSPRHIASLPPDAAPDVVPINNAKPVIPISV